MTKTITTNSDELAYAPAHELAARIRRRDLSPVEVVDAFIARIEARNPSLNALVYLGFDDARREARAAAALGVGGSHEARVRHRCPGLPALRRAPAVDGDRGGSGSDPRDPRGGGAAGSSAPTPGIGARGRHCDQRRIGAVSGAWRAHCSLGAGATCVSANCAVTGSTIVQKSLDRPLIRAVSGASQGRRVSTLGAGAGAEKEGLYPSYAPIAAALATVAASDGPLILLTQRRAAMRDRARTREIYHVASRSEADLHSLTQRLDEMEARIDAIAAPRATGDESGS
jgi:Protein of unknown function (DUF1003)